jgi:hypothetical protein
MIEEKTMELWFQFLNMYNESFILVQMWKKQFNDLS